MSSHTGERQGAAAPTAAALAFVWLAVSVACAAPGPAGAADEVGQVLTRVPPTEPAESLATFRTEPGFKVELIAAEPLVSDPVDIAWDEDGRLFVCEIWNYPGEPKAGEALGRVRLLESTRRDGVYDKSTIFADGLKWPGGVACYDGGVFVVSSPDLWFLKDTDGDGHADVRDKVLTGFAGKTYEVANCPRWGLDNWLYVSGSYAGGTVSKVGADGKPQGEAIRSRDFRFDPHTRELEAVSGGGEWGNTFDDWGDRFTCDATHMVWHPVLPRAELARNPRFQVASVQEMSIPEWTVLFPVSGPEPWKAARQKFWDRWVNTSHDMNAGRFPPTELEPHGFATSACGITVYRGSALGAEYLNDAFVAEPANNVVVRLKLNRQGVSVNARRPPQGESGRREFLASTDNWFRPVNFANGPDGCLYVVAMYREIIEDESAIPDDILRHYDLYTGRERGRILRVAPQSLRRQAPPRLGSATPAELARMLGHADAWQRETAQRLLVQRRPPQAAALVRGALAAKLPQGRIHALWTLEGLAALDEPSVLAALRDEDPRVREHAVRLAERLAGSSEAVRRRLIACADDADARVRFRVAFALALVPTEAATAALARVAERDAADPWARSAVVVGSAGRHAALFKALADDADGLALDGVAELLAALADVAGAADDGAQVREVISAISAPAMARHPNVQRAALRRLADGLRRAGDALTRHLAGGSDGNDLPPAVAEVFAASRREAADLATPEAARIDAIGLLAHLPGGGAADELAALLEPGQPAAVQVAAVRALASRPGEAAGRVLASKWRALGPAVRPAAADAMFRKPQRLHALLDAIERGQVAPADIEPVRRRELLEHSDPTVRARAATLVTVEPRADKKALVERYVAEVSKLSGDARRGEAVFRNACAACHRPERGQPVGPNLAILQDRSPPALIAAILDPDREVKPAFVNYVIRTRDGEDLAGVIANETASSVTLRQALGIEEVVPRANIASVRSTGLSLMPEGLEVGIDPQQMADLLRYLAGLRQ